MKLKTKIALFVGVAIILLIAYFLLSPLIRVIEVNEERSEGEDILKGVFVPRDHDVTGEVFVIENNGSKVLRFEDFETVNGPILHIYLSKDLEANDFIDLGGIKATKGNVSYEIPEGTNVEEYNHVLVWCVPFSRLFSSAELI